MSNTCPKCGAEKTDSVGWSCGSYELRFPNCKDKREFLQSDRCRGRAEAIAEVDAWHTGEPPKNKLVLISTGDGCIVLGIRNGKNMWVDGLGIFRWNPNWQWRQVRP